MSPSATQFDRDVAVCRTMLRGGSRSFFMASLLLPRAVRDPASALYAFCRLADDAVDLPTGDDAVPGLRHRLSLAYAGRPLPIPADRALAVVVDRFAIPRALPEALLEGFAWDAAGLRCEDVGDLHAYAVRVASSVGAMMALLMGARDPDALARACDLGVAMQLSNVARDVGEDARAARLYLPLRWLREAGVDPEGFLADPRFTPALGGVVRRVLDAAETFYRRATEGVALLPLGCRPGIGAARLLYAEIGREVARNGYDSVSRRAVVPRGRKVWLLGQAVLAAAYSPVAAGTPPLDAARHLVRAVTDAPALVRRPRAGALEQRVVWVCDLFEQLERRHRQPQVMPSGR